MPDSYPQKKSLGTANGEIFYWLDNSFRGRPFVILLHGLSSNHTTWLNIINVLRANGFNSLAPDLRGHGLSDKTKNKKLYDLGVFSDDLQNILAKEQINASSIVGYSFGGQIALDYAAKHPERVGGLVLISTNTAPFLKHLHLNFFTPLAAGCFDLAAALMRWQGRKKYHYYQHGKSVGYWDSVYDGLRTMPISVNFWMLARAGKADLERAMKQIKIPTIFLYGQKDTFITQREIKETAKIMPGAQVMFSKNPSHYVGTNAQDEIMQIILNFLKEHAHSNF